MRKRAKWRDRALFFCIFGAFFAPLPGAIAADPAPQQASNALSTVLLERAQNEVARIKALVENGTLPKTSLEEAEARLADAQDQAILSETLYGQARLQDITPAQAQAMVEAAQRRVDRQTAIVAERQKLLDTGILARSEFTSYQDELASRQRVLELAKSRATLVDDLRRMAETEQRFERAAQAPELKDVMIRYDGNGLFTLDDLPTISSEFEKRFHHPLPISALGQTLVHQSMGLDHRNRVDVALNPDLAEGIWLRQLLEKLHVPYLAFRSAFTGAATAPHIHIGTGSTRLKLAMRY
jgi:hypothetical protein